MPTQSLQRSEKTLRLDDEVRFIRSWLEKPLATGAVTPSGRVLARAMARYVDPDIPGPVIELGPGTGPVTEALLDQGVAQDRVSRQEGVRGALVQAAAMIPRVPMGASVVSSRDVARLQTSRAPLPSDLDSSACRAR